MLAQHVLEPGSGAPEPPRRRADERRQGLGRVPGPLRADAGRVQDLVGRVVRDRAAGALHVPPRPGHQRHEDGGRPAIGGLRQDPRLRRCRHEPFEQCDVAVGPELGQQPLTGGGAGGANAADQTRTGGPVLWPVLWPVLGELLRSVLLWIRQTEVLQVAGEATARLYGEDPADGMGGEGSIFLLLDEPEVYGLPPDPVVTTRDLAGMYRSAAAAAAAPTCFQIDMRSRVVTTGSGGSP